ncbi:hypothetical protein QVD17_18181 [Tagetes erecta]|uniref:Uncharacterized protein n=1 Tax=Tagetes erecta TaxID=13708 RepID=A0AAD8KMA0_TARER|nr:hypothetical protein QVD17_18181 [Tagetes erecta]
MTKQVNVKLLYDDQPLHSPIPFTASHSPSPPATTTAQPPADIHRTTTVSPLLYTATQLVTINHHFSYT